MTKSTISAVLCVAIATMFATSASAQQHLFSQYSTVGANSVNASAYPAPHPVPSYVGSSKYTYQPLMPHEMMYTHSRNYFNESPGNYYGGGSHLNVTKVRWQSGTMGYGHFPFSSNVLSNLKYRAAKRRYSVPLGYGASLSGGGGEVISDGGSFRGFLGRCSSCAASSYDADSDYSDYSEYAEPLFSAPTSGCASGSCATPRRASAHSAQLPAPEASAR